MAGPPLSHSASRAGLRRRLRRLAPRRLLGPGCLLGLGLGPEILQHLFCHEVEEAVAIHDGVHRADFRGILAENLSFVGVLQLFLHVVLLQDIDDAEEVRLGADCPVELARSEAAHLLLPHGEEGLLAVVLLLALRRRHHRLLGRGLHRNTDEQRVVHDHVGLEPLRVCLELLVQLGAVVGPEHDPPACQHEVDILEHRDARRLLVVRHEAVAQRALQVVHFRDLELDAHGHLEEIIHHHNAVRRPARDPNLV
mmetsp:Transcript_14696/g.38842  ORF Transcript_14696/g.38842 Transcript_14696/m.38842 type:complete len:253 (-) Transcript_14696:1498-2256(-)